MKLKKLCAIVMSCALLITTGCSSTNTQSKDDSKNSDVQQSTSASYPIKIKHAYGETIIESEPKNIAKLENSYPFDISYRSIAYISAKEPTWYKSSNSTPLLIYFLANILTR